MTQYSFTLPRVHTVPFPTFDDKSKPNYLLHVSTTTITASKIPVVLNMRNIKVPFDGTKAL